MSLLVIDNLVHSNVLFLSLRIKVILYTISTMAKPYLSMV